jgi:hypothetical protein
MILMFILCLLCLIKVLIFGSYPQPKANRHLRCCVPLQKENKHIMFKKKVAWVLRGCQRTFLKQMQDFANSNSSTGLYWVM